jgi:hypothetical protein
MCPIFNTACLTSDSQNFFDVNPMLITRKQSSDIYEILKNPGGVKSAKTEGKNGLKDRIVRFFSPFWLTLHLLDPDPHSEC